MSPEIYFSKNYSKEVDLWSLGILFYAIVSGFMPFEQDDVKKIMKMKNVNFVNFEPEPFNDFNKDGRDLINRILKVEPAERLKIDDILSHPYFQNELKKKKMRPKGVIGNVVIEEEEKEG
jgi:calcium/calmodulin-dependent protein kinase I